MIRFSSRYRSTYLTMSLRRICYVILLALLASPSIIVPSRADGHFVVFRGDSPLHSFELNGRDVGTGIGTGGYGYPFY